MAFWVWLRVRVCDLRSQDGEAGDVPGWVMVTVMTAGLVVALFAVFRGAIIGAVQDAISNVVSGTRG
ncbi:hypothetical protein [Fodinicola feengrottensis]|uniref:hypothetical protein n=1 Tax=Fodinicola feengrottensis TaxID=435914 RepID=UPI002440F53F|nr:hypothetical protein [Fodinicola feengrottensis]